MGIDVRSVRGQSGQGGRRGPSPAPSRQDSQYACEGAGEPERLRPSGPRVASVDFGGQTRRGRGQGASGAAHERRSRSDRRSGRVGSARYRDGPSAEGAACGSRSRHSGAAESRFGARGQRAPGQGRPDGSHGQVYRSGAAKRSRAEYDRFWRDCPDPGSRPVGASERVPRDGPSSGACPGAGRAGG